MNDENSQEDIKWINPYVGPRAFTSKDAHWFKGRTRETSELLSLLMARRLVLFYAQSGAGKTSLLNARLIPKLEEPQLGFEVLPVGRVGDAGDPPDGVVNRFAFNLIVSLGVVGKPEKLASVAISDFLLDLIYDGESFTYARDLLQGEIGSPEADVVEETETSSVEVKPRLLVIDQFEEIFTIHPELERDRIDFFKQIAQAMQDDPYLYVLFSMRGDYYHQLTPYVHLLPDNLRSRYYMERLREEAALKAVRLPALEEGRPFTDEVSQKLVTYLRRLKTSSPETDQQEDEKLDPYVETVQLQVVCRQLWQSLESAEIEEIGMEDVERVALERAVGSTPYAGQSREGTTDALATFIDNALADYYEHAICKTHEHPDVDIPEYKLRDLFSKKLIFGSEFRNLLPRGDTETEGIPEIAIHLLDTEHHIIRNDMRGGRKFIELVHDSFIEPILKANQDWEIRRAQDIRWLDKAFKYKDTGESKYLLSGQDLVEAQQTNPEILENLPPEAESFLKASRDAEQRRENEKLLRDQELKLRQQKAKADLELEQQKADAARKRADAAENARNRQRKLTIGVSIVTVFAVVFLGLAILAWIEATQREAEAVEAKETAVAAEATADVLRGEAEEAATTAEAAELEAREAQSEAIANELEARAAEEEALAAQKETESLRIADKAQSFFENAKFTPALLVGYVAVDLSPSDEAVEVLSKTLSIVLDTIPGTEYPWQDNPEEMKALACELAGRNLTASELAAQFTEPYEVDEIDLRRTCEQYDFHISLAEQALRKCTNLPDAESLFNESEVPLDEEGQPLSFEAWKGEILFDEALKSRKRACLDLAGLNETDAGKFISIINQLDPSFTVDETVEQELNKVIQLDQIKGGLPKAAAEALDQRFSEIYGYLCLDLNVVMGTANRACQRYNALAEIGRYVPITITNEIITPTLKTRTYSFDGITGQVASFEVVTYGSDDPVSLLLNSPDGMILQPNVRRSERIDDDMFDRYVYLLSESDEYSFDLQWYGDLAPVLDFVIKLDEPQTLSIGEKVEPQDGRQWWKFEGDPGDILKITMDALDEGDPVLQLLNSQGELIFESYNSLNGLNASIEVVLPEAEDDTYFINAGWYDFDTGRYLLKVDSVEAEIDYGQTLDGTAARRYWQFNAVQGNIVTIKMNAINEGDPYLVLLDVEGEQIAFKDNGTEGLDPELDAIIPVTGTYYIEAGWNDTAGPYTISLNKIEPRLLEINGDVQTATSEERLWQFDGQTGDIIAIAMTAIEDDVPDLKLLNSNNVVLANKIAEENEQNAVIQWQLVDDDTYYIDAGWIGNAGPYELSVVRVELQQLLLDELNEGDADEIWWLVEGTQGAFVEISLEASTPDSYPQLFIYNEEGIEPPYRFDDLSQEALLQILFPETGNYYLRIRWQKANPYSISMSAFDTDSDPELAADLYKRNALNLVRQGDIEQGLTLLDEFQNIDSGLEIYSDEYNTICRYGSLWGFADQVLFACEEAVSLDPNYAYYRDSRGIALAILGETEAAITDFQYYVDTVGFGPDVDLRLAWIEELEAGGKPFDNEELLEQLRNP